MNQLYLPVDDLVRETKPRHGGLITVLYTPIDNLVNLIPLALPVYVDNAALLLKAKTKWYKAYFKPPRGGYTEATKQTNAGTHTEVAVKCTIPFDNYNNARRLDFMKYRKYILLVTDATGMIRVVGNKDNGCMLNFIFDTGDTEAGKLGTEIIFTGLFEDSPPIVQFVPEVAYKVITAGP